MKNIKYNLCTKVNRGTDENPQWVEILSAVTIPYSESNITLAEVEAYKGEYTVEDDGMEEVTTPSQLDVIEAQVTYTAMMTDTLLEV